MTEEKTIVNTPALPVQTAAPVVVAAVPPAGRSFGEEEVEIDLLELFYLLWQKIWLIMLWFILGAAAAFAYTYFMITPLYTATAKMYILSSSSSSVVNLSDLQISNNLRSDYKELLTSRPVLEKVITSLNLDYSYGGLKSKVSITNPTDTRILNVTVTTPSPQLSADIANELVRQGQKDLPAIMKTDEPSIFENAIVPTTKSSPSFTKNTLIGGMLAAMLYCAFIVIRHISDDTFITPDDVYRTLGIQPLAVIPEADLGDFNRDVKKKSKKKGKRNR